YWPVRGLKRARVAPEDVRERLLARGGLRVERMRHPLLVDLEEFGVAWEGVRSMERDNVERFGSIRIQAVKRVGGTLEGVYRPSDRRDPLSHLELVDERRRRWARRRAAIP